MGMGDAFSALADDINTLNYNPAGLARLETIEATLEYANLYAGLNDGRIQENHLALSYPLPESGGLGLGWNNRSVVDIYSENEIVLGYALHPGVNLPLWLGLSGKLFYWDYTDSSFLEMSRTRGIASQKYQYGLDFGALYTLFKQTYSRPEIQIACSIINLNQPDIGIVTENRLPLETRAGLSVQWQDWDGALDAVWLNSKFQIHVGAEKWFGNGQWGVRTGLISGDDTAFTATVGANYNFDWTTAKSRLTYAFNYTFSGIIETWGTHRISLDFEIPQLATSGRAAPTTLPKRAPASSMPVTPDRKERIQTYLMKKFETYFEATETIKQLKAKNNPRWANDLALAEQKLHDAVGQIIVNENVVEFLKSVNAVSKILRALQDGQP